MPSLVDQAKGCQESFKNKHLSGVPVRRRNTSIPPGAPVPPPWDKVDSYERVLAHLQTFCQLKSLGS